METEAAMVIYFYLGMSFVFIGLCIAVWLLKWMRDVMQDMNNFVKLMVGLYEEEKAKNDKKDGERFGPREF